VGKPNCLGRYTRGWCDGCALLGDTRRARRAKRKRSGERVGGRVQFRRELQFDLGQRRGEQGAVVGERGSAPAPGVDQRRSEYLFGAADQPPGIAIGESGAVRRLAQRVQPGEAPQQFEGDGRHLRDRPVVERDGQAQARPGDTDRRRGAARLPGRIGF